MSGDVYDVDRKGVCSNCGTVAKVVKDGHNDPDGGPFRGGDRVRCELTYPETAEGSTTDSERRRS